MSINKKQKVKQKKKSPSFKFFKRMWRLFVLSVLALFFWLMYCYVVIITHPFDEEVEKSDAAIVLGAALWNDRPSPALRERLNHALQLYLDEKVTFIIVSGGKGVEGQNLSEAEGMRNYLIEQGASGEHILLEQHATNTYENLLFSQAIVKKEQFNNVVIVSHAYHAYRTDKIADYLNYEHYQVSGIESLVLNKPYHYTREVLAYSKWVLNKLTLRIGFYLD